MPGRKNIGGKVCGIGAVVVALFTNVLADHLQGDAGECDGEEAGIAGLEFPGGLPRAI
ncbi:MAG: hypothetical protein WCQ57_02910 [Verrucomicrobiota bacterium]